MSGERSGRAGGCGEGGRRVSREGGGRVKRECGIE